MTLKHASVNKWLVPLLLYVAVILIFIFRTILAFTFVMPSLFEIFNLVVLLLSATVLIRWYSVLTRFDIFIAIFAGLIMGLLLTFTTFNPLLHFNDIILDSIGHGFSLIIILAAGLVLMRQGGPIQFALAERSYRMSGYGILLGLIIGIPFAIINAFAFSMMQGQPFIFQDPLISAISALQPGFVEEVVYRFTFLSILWTISKSYNPHRAIQISAFLALLVHNYAHLTDLFMVQPIFALVYGAIIGLLFGLPPTLLALKRNLESAIAFHWIVDFVRFLTGF